MRGRVGGSYAGATEGRERGSVLSLCVFFLKDEQITSKRPCTLVPTREPTLYTFLSSESGDVGPPTSYEGAETPAASTAPPLPHLSYPHLSAPSTPTLTPQHIGLPKFAQLMSSPSTSLPSNPSTTPPHAPPSPPPTHHDLPDSLPCFTCLACSTRLVRPTVPPALLACLLPSYPLCLRAKKAELTSRLSLGWCVRACGGGVMGRCRHQPTSS